MSLLPFDVLHDICLKALPGVFAVDRGGIVSQSTHSRCRRVGVFIFETSERILANLRVQSSLVMPDSILHPKVI
ncbi:hypothetical protein ACFL0Q_09555 [Thermodesulfobacteriota bacterium]